ncbi:hypothetical protein Q9S36_30305 [Microbacterium sp. ARD31]|uniref:hypothetical protein n=1 Tax=Microbacterium sp. ARD31 TaxID=2962576 RepID=UPI002881C0BB|nr:hypothetical protein [Microbacterium sp. ARD31]MDT0184490.1 hypothetical protein [Microbacterium sp. ARD31]
MPVADVAFAAPAIPRGWDKVARPRPGTVWTAVEPVDLDRPDGFRSNLVLTCDDLGGLTFRDWQVGSDEVLPTMLDDYLLVDLERLVVDGRPGGRRLAHHVDQTGRALTMEQWFVADDQLGWTLTATVETWAYDGVADELAEVAAAWRPLTGPRAGATA